MVIGGFALPAYGEVRTTLDIDIAVRVEKAIDYDALVAMAKESGLQPSVSSFRNAVNVFIDKESGVEVELWLRPDGVSWDSELIRRRKKARMGSVEAMLIPPEDFIVTKLSRPDRGAQDEKDVRGVLARLSGTLDRPYLNRRAKRAGVAELLHAIERE